MMWLLTLLRNFLRISQNNNPTELGKESNIMPSFSEFSKKNLSEAHPDLQKLFNEVIEHYDCRVIEGNRSEEEQNRLYEQEKSKVQYPNSKHNQSPSLAVDVVPCPIDWNDIERFRHFSGFVQGMATSMNIKIRWGGDWDSDRSFKDQKFHDLPHFELVL